MPESEQDILVDISDEDLPQLLKMYEKHKDWVPHVYSIIETGIDWRKKRKEKYLQFMSPNGCWKEDGTFFVLLAHNAFDLFIFSLDDSGKNIYEGIMKTNRLDPGDFKDREGLLYAIHEKFYPIVSRAMIDKGITLVLEIPCHMFTISKKEAVNFNIECPPDVYIKKLDPSHALLINSVWPHRYKNSENFVSLLIEMNPAYGIFLKSTDELASWIIISMLGQLALLQTVDEHKQKGYGSLITKYMSKELAIKGHNPFGTVLEENVTSIKMFTKNGFKRMGIATYASFEKSQVKA